MQPPGTLLGADNHRRQWAELWAQEAFLKASKTKRFECILSLAQAGYSQTSVSCYAVWWINKSLPSMGKGSGLNGGRRLTMSTLPSRNRGFTVALVVGCVIEPSGRLQLALASSQESLCCGRQGSKHLRKMRGSKRVRNKPIAVTPHISP